MNDCLDKYRRTDYAVPRLKKGWAFATDENPQLTTGAENPG